MRAIAIGLIQLAGLTRGSRARTGGVTLIQRFGSALNLNVHLHMIILDGVYTLEGNVNAPERLRRHPSASSHEADTRAAVAIGFEPREEPTDSAGTLDRVAGLLTPR